MNNMQKLLDDLKYFKAHLDIRQYSTMLEIDNHYKKHEIHIYDRVFELIPLEIKSIYTNPQEIIVFLKIDM